LFLLQLSKFVMEEDWKLKAKAVVKINKKNTFVLHA